MALKKVVVLGATGLVGAQLVDRLVADPNIGEVVCLTRSAHVSPHSKVSVHMVNFMDLDAHQALFESVTDVVCCIGTTMKQAKTREQFQIVDHYIPKVVARIAKSKGGQSYSLVSSVGARSSSGSFYLSVKGNVEDEIKKAGFSTVRIYRPSLLLGNRSKKRWVEWLMGVVFAMFFWMIPKKYAPTDASVLAEMMASHLHQMGDGVHIYEAGVIK